MRTNENANATVIVGVLVLEPKPKAKRSKWLNDNHRSAWRMEAGMEAVSWGTLSDKTSQNLSSLVLL